MSEQEVLAAPPRHIRFDDGRHARAKIGYVLLATEQTVQDDVMRLRPPGVGVHFTRAAIPDSITSESRNGISIITANFKESYKIMRPIFDDLRRKVETVQVMRVSRMEC